MDRATSTPLISSQASEALDRFVQALDASAGGRARTQHTLCAVRAALMTDAAFLGSPRACKSADILADAQLGPGWCRQLLRRQLRRQLRREHVRHGPTANGRWLMASP